MNWNTIAPSPMEKVGMRPNKKTISIHLSLVTKRLR